MKHWIWHVHGHGAHEEQTVFTLDTKICGFGAPADVPYISWVIAASNANIADVTFDDGSNM